MKRRKSYKKLKSSRGWKKWSYKKNSNMKSMNDKKKYL